MDDPRLSRPTVVAIVVVLAPVPSNSSSSASVGISSDVAMGELEATLRGLTAQQPRPAILVVDGRGTVDAAEDARLREAVAIAAPHAFVRRTEVRVGYAEAANEAMVAIEGATYLFFCPPGSVPLPGAVQALSVEAARANAGVLGPKLVSRNDDERLLAFGYGLDRLAHRLDVVDPGELDQQQHDLLKESPALPASALLVRVDLFNSLGGFDPKLNDPGEGPGAGEEVDLCWRARLAGARVMATPEARVAARPLTLARERVDAKRVRTLAVVLSGRRLLVALPLVLIETLWSALRAVLSGRPASARHSLAAWGHLFAHPVDVVARRRRTQQQRVVSDAEIHRSLAPFAARTRRALRDDVLDDSARVWAVAERALALRRGRWRAVSMVGVAVVLLVGSRKLLSGSLPRFGGFLPIPSPRVLVGEVTRGWRSTGLGNTGTGPLGFLPIALLGLVFRGATLQKVILLGQFPLGLWGASRLAARVAVVDSLREARRAGSTISNIRVVAVIAYGCVPLPYNALAAGRPATLLMYGILPWVAVRLVTLQRAGDAANLARTTSHFSYGAVPPAPRWWLLVRFAIPAAILIALVPSAFFVLLVVIVGFQLGTLLSGRLRGVLSGTIAMLAGLAAAVVLLAPFAVELSGADAWWSAVAGSDRTRSTYTHAVDLLRVGSGPRGPGALAAALVLTALLPLLIAEGDRLVWAIRAWAVAAFAFTIAWAGGRGWLGWATATPDLFLVTAGLMLSLACSLGLAGSMRDVRRRRFGWRQLVLVGGVVGLMVSATPVVWAARQGRWRAPERGLNDVLGWLEDPTGGPHRTLWLGSPGVLPGQGWSIEPDLSMVLTDRGVPTLLDTMPGQISDGSEAVRSLVRAVMLGRTSRLGRGLARAGVRYVVLASRAAPGARPLRPLPAVLNVGLSSQLDLRQVDLTSGFVVYENTEFAGETTVLSASQGHALASAPDGVRLDPAGALTLSAATPTSVAPGSWVFTARTFSDRWRLRIVRSDVVNSVAPQRVLGWGQAFELPVGTSQIFDLTLRRSLTRDVLLGLDGLLWIVAFIASRRRHLVDAMLAPGDERSGVAIDAEHDRWGDPFSADDAEFEIGELQPPLEVPAWSGLVEPFDRRDR